MNKTFFLPRKKSGIAASASYPFSTNVFFAAAGILAKIFEYPLVTARSIQIGDNFRQISMSQAHQVSSVAVFAVLNL
jgi:hypothetical protein